MGTITLRNGHRIAHRKLTMCQAEMMSLTDELQICCTGLRRLVAADLELWTSDPGSGTSIDIQFSHRCGTRHLCGSYTATYVPTSTNLRHGGSG